MLIIVPPSETKRQPPDGGPPVDLATLSFPELTPMRERVLEALIETSAGEDAFDRLYLRPSMVAQIVRNTWLREAPTSPASDVYSGPLHQGLDVASMSPPARARAEETCVVVSPLWGMLRLGDRIPAYRVGLFVRLVGIRQRLDAEWREILPDVLAAAAADRPGLILDLRSPENQMIGKPTGLDHRTVRLRVHQGRPGHRIGDVIAKRVRGQAARHLLASGEEPGHPEALADTLAEQWPTRLKAPFRADDAWELTLTTND